MLYPIHQISINVVAQACVYRAVSLKTVVFIRLPLAGATVFKQSSLSSFAQLFYCRCLAVNERQKEPIRHVGLPWVSDITNLDGG